VNDIDDFVALLRDDLGLDVTRADLDAEFDAVPGWDSVHLLQLLQLLERDTRHSLSLPEMLEAPNLARVYELAVRS
jgi:acyl carrier protein